MKILDINQGTPEWIEARRAMITGTKMDSVMGSALDRLMLACELIAEEATEQSKAFKVTPEMERGTDEEVFARKHFEKITGNIVKEIGFCISDEFAYLGVSGDGWIKHKGVLDEALEIKSPDTKNAVFYKLADKLSPQFLGLGNFSTPTVKNPEPVFKFSSKAPFLGIPAIYKWQMVTYFLVNEKLNKFNFCIYDARFIDEKSKMHIITINRDNELLQEALKEARTELISFREFWLKCRESIIMDNF